MNLTILIFFLFGVQVELPEEPGDVRLIESGCRNPDDCTYLVADGVEACISYTDHVRYKESVDGCIQNSRQAVRNQRNAKAKCMGKIGFVEAKGEPFLPNKNVQSNA